VFTYTFLGILAGSASAWLLQSTGGIMQLQRAFSIGAGVIMIAIGLSSFGWIRLKFAIPGSVALPFATAFRTLLSAPERRTVFLAGVMNGFLPCGLVYAFLALALASGRPVQGGLLMLAFGLGTVPAMTIVGCGSSLISHHARAKVFRAAAVLVIITGGITVYRALPTRSNCCSGSASAFNVPGAATLIDISSASPVWF
jgi:sulfite exporter TauE/SafE